MNLNKADWVHIGQWVQPVLSAWFWRNWGKNIPEGFPQLSGDIMVLHGHHFSRKSDMEKLHLFVKQTVQDPALRERCARWVKESHTIAKRNAERTYETPEEELQALEESFATIISPWLFFLLLDGALTEEFEAECERQGVSFDEIAQLLQPLEKSFVVQQHEEAQQLYEKIQAHVNRFAFCGMHHFVGSPYTMETFFENMARQHGKN